MAHFLLQITWSTEVAAALVERPRHHLELLRPLAAQLGGSVDAAFATFGEFDFVGLVQMPDNVSMVAFSKSISTSGASKSIRTTPLITFEDEMEAMARAASTEFSPPGSE